MTARLDFGFSDSTILYGFECKECGDIWFSRFCYCCKCQKVPKFKILDRQEIIEYVMNRMRGNEYED